MAKKRGQVRPWTKEDLRTLKTLAADIEGYSQTKGALHFDKPLPAALVRKLVKTRMAESATKIGSRPRRPR